MGRRRWKRFRLADLADRETQARLLRGIETAQEGNQAPEPGEEPPQPDGCGDCLVH